jgi:hypothetical protein
LIKSHLSLSQLQEVRDFFQTWGKDGKNANTTIGIGNGHGMSGIGLQGMGAREKEKEPEECWIDVVIPGFRWM